MISTLPKKGYLLIAEPSTLGDVSFNRSVVLLAEHNSEGSIGFILNKPLNYTINDLLPEIEASFKIYNGGPVEQDNLYFIHNIPEIIPNSIEISNGIYWGGDFETTKHLINTGEINKNNIRFFLGYSGWSVNQLEMEMQENAWIVSENSLKKKLLSKSSNQFWKEKIIEQGGEYVLFSNAPENPMLN
jgi:putative transcriptional regulator